MFCSSQEAMWAALNPSSSPVQPKVPQAKEPQAQEPKRDDLVRELDRLDAILTKAIQMRDAARIALDRFDAALGSRAPSVSLPGTVE